MYEVYSGGSEPVCFPVHYLPCWSSYILGFCVVGLESGFIFMYRVGWKISVGQVVTSIALSVVLIFVGILFYKETISVSKIAGILVCMAGLYLINR